VWSWLIWLSKRRIGRLFSIWSCIFVLCKLWGISWLTKEMLGPLYECWPVTLHYWYCTAVGWSYHQLRSQLPSLFYNILAKISNTVNCNKYQFSFGRYISQFFRYLILSTESDVYILSVSKLHIGHIWHPTKWECILCNSIQMLLRHF
jgi:hypothetical protein